MKNPIFVSTHDVDNLPFLVQSCCKVPEKEIKCCLLLCRSRSDFIEPPSNLGKQHSSLATSDKRYTMKGRVVSNPTSESGRSDTTEADQFREDLYEMIAGQKSNEQLMTRAQDLIDSLGERDDPNEFVPSWYKRCRTEVNRILGSMLACSYGCGGRDSQRYVSCAIIACTVGTKSSEDTHRALTELAISWFANFLWICKSPLSYHFTSKTTRFHV